MDKNNFVSYIGKISGRKYVADLSMLKEIMKTNGIREFKYALNFNTGRIHENVGYNNEPTSPASEDDIKLYNSLIVEYEKHFKLTSK